MKIGIAGAGGRMGRMLGKAVLAADGCILSGGTERPGSPLLGQDLALLAGGITGAVTDGVSTGAIISEDARDVISACDVFIDFTAPEPTAEHARIAATTGTALVIGTTGMTGAEQSAVVAASASTAIVQAGNMSLGVNLLVGLANQVGASLGMEYDIEIVEMHHKHKVDAPSGTALMLGRAAAEGRGVDHDEVSVLSREGITGEREDGSIGYATLRGGSVVGEHSIIFAGPGERLELTHRAGDRDIFAHGAVQAARWVFGKEPGHYSMRDVLGLG